MTAPGVSDGEKIERAGSRTLEMLASELNVKIMRVMAGGFDALTVQMHEVSPDVEPEHEVSPEVEIETDEPKYTIAPGGREALAAANVIEYWLLKAAEGPLAYEDPAAEEAIEALAEGWAMAVIHAFAHGPMTAAGLERALPELGRREIAYLLERMHRAAEIEVRSGEGEDTVYAATEWLRRASGPIAICARLERRLYPGKAVPIDALDVESALLLSLPLVRLPGGLSGSCRLSVGMDGPPDPPPAGATVAVEEGQVASCTPGLDEDAAAEASGDIGSWLDAIIDGDIDRVDFGGDRPLARAIVEQLHEVLFVAG